ncbi:MAG: sulfurtransferase TusA family protein [Actinobacteria bacterium]|nr:MAG: sulfurtransferase TusA family protein [Actinomycetota bacterium]
MAKYDFDLSGVPCPINFVKTKLKLEELTSGDTLEVLLDDGEPISSVPRAVKDEGHKVLKVEPEGKQYKVLIERK